MGNLVLTDFFATKSEANDFSARLGEISQRIYEVDFNLEKTLQDNFGSKKKVKFMSLLRENEIPKESGAALTKFLGEIQQNISALPVVNLTLATEPDEQILKAISDWFILNLKKQMLIEFTVDPNLIAGASVEFQGKHLDGSIKSVFDKVSTSR